MKKLLLFLFVAFMSINAAAQYSNPADYSERKPVDIRGSRVFVDKQKLDKECAALCFSNVNGVDRSSDYLKYRAGYKTGLGLTFGGLALAGAGFLGTSVSTIIALTKAFTDESTLGVSIAAYASIGSFFVGSACFVAGIPVACVYKARLNKLEKAHNASLQVQATTNGLALSLSF